MTGAHATACCTAVSNNSHETIMLLVVFYSCETWSLTLTEKHKLSVFEDKVLSKIFEVKRDGVYMIEQ